MEQCARLLSLGPDCGVRTRIDEQALPWNRRGATQFFDWMLSSLAAVAAVLDCADPDAYFATKRWRLVRVWPSGSYEFVHVPTGLRSLHDSRVSEYESADAARSEVAARYARRSRRLRELVDAPGALRFVHVVDGENEMNVQLPPSRETVRRVRALLAPRHHLVIVHDGGFATHASLSAAGVALIDTRWFRLHQAPGRVCERGDAHADADASAGWRRTHLDWEALMLAVSDAVPPADILRLEVDAVVDGEGVPRVQLVISCCGDQPPLPGRLCAPDTTMPDTTSKV